MLIVRSIPFRGRRRRAVLPPVALTLSAAAYASGTSLTLTFDRPIRLAHLDGSKITIRDAAITRKFYDGGGGAMLVSPTVVQLLLRQTGSCTGGPTTLTATVANGIAAINDGGTWAGVSGLVLPFP